MIATIDALRQAHNSAISEAIKALDDLGDLVSIPDMHAMEAQYMNAIDAIDRAADKGIGEIAELQDAQSGQAVIHVGGDYIQVGDISDSKNIAIGKDMRQDISE